MLDVRLTHPNAKLPQRANSTDAGLDLFTTAIEVFHAGEKGLVDTGVQARIPDGFVGLLFARSSLQKKNLMLANSVGVIDSSYRGNIMAAMYNFGDTTTYLNAGDKIAQLVIVPCMLYQPNQVEEDDASWNNTIRGIGGFGSTGV